MAMITAPAMKSTVNGNSKTGGEVQTDNTMKAAYFKALGCRLVDVRGQRPKTIFVFESVPEHLIRAYDLDTAQVSPVQFGLAYNQLLRLVHA